MKLKIITFHDIDEDGSEGKMYGVALDGVTAQEIMTGEFDCVCWCDDVDNAVMIMEALGSESPVN